MLQLRLPENKLEPKSSSSGSKKNVELKSSSSNSEIVFQAKKLQLQLRF